MNILLETERLRLRVICSNDLNRILQLDGDPQVMRFIGEGKPRTLEDVEKKMEKMLRYCEEHPGLGTWLIETKNRNFIGSACLKHLDDTDEIEMGYYFLEAYWGRGYATEVVNALVEYGQKELRLPKIVATTHPENQASIHVLEKCGFTFEGTGTWYGFLSNHYSIESGP